MNMNAAPLVREHTVGQTRWLEIDNPPANLLDAAVCAALHRAVRAANADPQVRSIVLTGAPDDHFIFHFSIAALRQVGIDNGKLGLNWLVRTGLGRWLFERQSQFALWLMAKSDLAERLLLGATRALYGQSTTLYTWLQLMALADAIERSPKPTIAAINGSCNGGGAELSACCDFRFMVADAGFSLGQPEITFGIIAGGGGTQRWTRLLGRARALELLLLGEQWSAAQAKAAGLITDHFPQAEFAARVQAFAERIERRSAIAVAQTKRAVVHGEQTSLNHGLAIEVTGICTCLAEPGTQRFLDAYQTVIERETAGKQGNFSSTAIIAQADSDALAGLVHAQGH